jgi:hypothetical protein
MSAHQAGRETDQRPTRTDRSQGENAMMPSSRLAAIEARWPLEQITQTGRSHGRVSSWRGRSATGSSQYRNDTDFPAARSGAGYDTRYDFSA